MVEVLRPMQISVEKDLSGGVKVGFGPTIGLMSPEQAFEFGMLVLKAAGVNVDIGPQFAMPKQKHFRPG